MKHAFLWRRLCCSALLLTLVFAPLGCKRKSRVRVQQTDEESPRMASTVHMGDPKAETQLVSGFYGIEDNAWRWTQRQFSVVLHPPFGSAAKGATLHVRLTVPDAVIAKLKTISLFAAISGSTLPPETYTQPGTYTYTRDVAARLLTGESVRVDFGLNKAMPPTGADLRELGLVVLEIGLEPK